MASQTTHTILMVSPDYFGFNSQTATTNVFQKLPSLPDTQIQKNAFAEFKKMVKMLRAHHIQVLVLPSRKNVITPDAVFPNNWFSMHEDGTLVIYPMLTPDRQDEKQMLELREKLHKHKKYTYPIIDLGKYEKEGKILEGTGSMVLDREHKVAFSMLSLLADEEIFTLWCAKLGFSPVSFHGYDSKKVPIYHINIAMSIGEKFVVICFDSIINIEEKERVKNELIKLKKEIIPITFEQMFAFCANILEVQNMNGKHFIVMSTAALNAFTTEQKQKLEQYGEILATDLSTIEEVGVGSARCMMAEIF